MYILHRDLCGSLYLFIYLLVSLGAGMNNAMIRELEHFYAFSVGFYLLSSDHLLKTKTVLFQDLLALVYLLVFQQICRAVSVLLSRSQRL